MKKPLLIFILLLTFAFSNEVQIKNVKAVCDKNRVCTFKVTLKHKDTSWKHYANKWEIYTPKGKLLGKRVLYHPHIKEQPFTRSLSKVKIPKGINKVLIKAHDSIHGYSKKAFIYELKF